MKAYPIMYKHPTTGLIVEHEGLDARDWFAGMAMQSLMADTSDYSPFEKIAEASYKLADEMMKARESKDD